MSCCRACQSYETLACSRILPSWVTDLNARLSRNKRRALSLAENVSFVGPKSGDGLAEILNQHQILVVPSRWAEPFGIVAVEGIACGCVVVGSVAGGLPEAIGGCGVNFSQRGLDGTGRRPSRFAEESCKSRPTAGRRGGTLKKIYPAADRRNVPDGDGRAMILLTHPTGNANLRAVADALERGGMLQRLVTTIGWTANSSSAFPNKVQSKLRRTYAVPTTKLETHPLREAVRLLAGKVGPAGWTAHEKGWASLDGVARDLDRYVARRVRRKAFGELRAVYSYEDCAERTFEAARDLGLRRIYDLPIAYWETAQKLLREEVARSPDWAFSLAGASDSEEKLARKARELEAADLIVCPSNFVLESLPDHARRNQSTVVAPFGSPAVRSEIAISKETKSGPLRVLFAGGMTQRKGLADVFAAMRLLKSKNVELVVMGSPLRELAWYQQQYPDFRYEPPRPHEEVLELMRSCDALLLPSIVEGRALVQQEAMSCGLPIIVTKNAGGDDLVVEGQTGFLVPIRAPEAIADRLDWLLAHRSELNGMRIAAQSKAAEFTWTSYGDQVVAAIRRLLAT